MTDYHRATNEALKFHLKAHSFPLDVIGLARSLGIHLWTYRDLTARAGIFCACPSEHGFTVVSPKSDKKAIFYNQCDPKPVRLFTVAHELAHCVLEHRNRSDDEEKEANCFARNLLCPIWIAQAKGLEAVDDYTRVFGVSGTMAEISIKQAHSDIKWTDPHLAASIVQAFQRREHQKTSSPPEPAWEAFDRAEENWLYGFVG